MKEQFVTFEIAKLLFLLGFNEPCLAVYFKGEFQIPRGFGMAIVTEEHTKILKGDSILAPLWQQVIDWLETKGIFISIEYAAPDTNKFQYRIDNYNPVCTKTSMIPDGKGWKKSEPEPSGSFGNYSKEWFEKRIEATEAAILEAIKLIP